MCNFAIENARIQTSFQKFQGITSCLERDRNWEQTIAKINE